MASTTSAAPTSLARSPTRTRSTSDPSVQWQFGAATTAVSSSIPSIKRAVQSGLRGAAR